MVKTWWPAAAMAIAVPAAAAFPLAGLLGQASDSALDKLARPGAFQADPAVRIVAPGAAGRLGGLLKLADRAGVTAGLTKSLNDAAGIAAGEAKPIFRAAIDRLTVPDAVGVVGQSDGGTRYLRESAGADLRGKLRPLMVNALGRTGAFVQVDRAGAAGGGLLGRAGITRDTLTDSVTDQALNGIYKYIGAEETKARANPAGTVRSLLDRLRR